MGENEKLELAELAEAAAGMYIVHGPQFRRIAEILRTPAPQPEGGGVEQSQSVLLDHAIECLQLTMTGKTSKLQAAISYINLVKNSLPTHNAARACAGVGSVDLWRDIATAPKHGGHFWAFQKNRGQYECWWYNDGREAYWMDINDSEPDPTHWMPLPAAPGSSPPVTQPQRQDEPVAWPTKEQVWDCIRLTFSEKIAAQLSFKRWKDGIDIDHPTPEAMLLAKQFFAMGMVATPSPERHSDGVREALERINDPATVFGLPVEERWIKLQEIARAALKTDGRSEETPATDRGDAA